MGIGIINQKFISKTVFFYKLKRFIRLIFSDIKRRGAYTAAIDLFLVDKNCEMRYNYNVIVKWDYRCVKVRIYAFTLNREA